MSMKNSASPRQKVPGLVWSRKKMETAAKQGKFIAVGSDKSSSGSRVLSGAVRKWENGEETNVIYNLTFRIMGEPGDVRRALELYAKDHPTDLSQNEINSGLAESNNITYENSGFRSGNFSQKFVDEVAKAKRFKESLKKENPALTMRELVWAMNNFDKATYDLSDVKSSKKKKEKKEKSGSSSPKKSSKPKDLLSALDAARKAGKFVDLSGLREGTYKKYRTVDKLPSDRTGVYYLEEFPIFSTNFDSFVRVLRAFYSDKAEAAISKLESQRGQFKTQAAVVPGQTVAGTVTIGSSPRTSGSSPRVSGGAMGANLPRFTGRLSGSSQ